MKLLLLHLVVKVVIQETEIEAENRIREELHLAVDDDDSILDNTTSSTTHRTSTSTHQRQPSTSSSNDINGRQIRGQQQRQILPSFLINETRQ